MIKDWHMFRLQSSGKWIKLGSKSQYLVDSSISTENIHTANNI